MSDAVIVAMVSSVVSPTILFVFQLIREWRDKNAMRLRRVEIMQNLQMNPDDTQTIMSLYDEYSKRGGNSYIKERITEWKKTRGKHVNTVAKRRK